MGKVESPLSRLHALGLELPPVPMPIANYLPAVRHNDLVYVSGHGSVGQDGEKYIGRVDGDFTVEQGQKAARLAALNCLAALTCVAPLDHVRQILKVTGYVHSTDGFTGQPEVLNGASDLLVEIFGEAGRHARTAIGLRQTARSFTVQLEMLIIVKE
jgi:enamine deaminase RidA (YjgF/YER057c/UK114 family)